MIRIAAHQPNFLPYLGFFHKWYTSDLFILLDDVQITTGSSDAYTHRTQLVDNQGNRQWFTLPLEQDKLPINEVVIQSGEWMHQVQRKMLEYYGRLYNYYQYASKFAVTVGGKLDHNNIDILIKIGQMSDIPQLSTDKLVRSSTVDYDKTLKKSERLKSIFDEVALGMDYSYYSGIGAKSYLDESLFKVEYSNWTAKHYEQEHHSTPFVANASILDYIFNHGFDNLEKYIK